MSRVLFQPDDELPPTKLVRAARVLPGDVVWGIQWQDNLRKGFLLETEGFVCEAGAVATPDGVRIGSRTPVDPDHLVIIEKR